VLPPIQYCPPLSALTICALYKQRWQVALFFTLLGKLQDGPEIGQHPIQQTLFPTLGRY